MHHLSALDNFVREDLQTRSQSSLRTSRLCHPTTSPQHTLLKNTTNVKSQPNSSDDSGQSDSEWKHQRLQERRQKLEELRQYKQQIADCVKILEQQSKSLEDYKTKADIFQKEGKKQMTEVTRQAIIRITSYRQTLTRQMQMFKLEVKKIEGWCLSNRT